MLTYSPRTQSPRLVYISGQGNVLDIDDLPAIAAMLEAKADEVRRYEAALNQAIDEEGTPV